MPPEAVLVYKLPLGAQMNYAKGVACVAALAGTAGHEKKQMNRLI